jgi:CzcA family heavy metal efflux pump
VASVTVFGADKRSIQIQVHPDELIRFGLALEDIVSAARRATGVRGAGFVDTTNQRIVFQTEGQSLTPADIGRTVLFSHGAASVTLSNVADVIEAPEPPIGGASIQGKPGVILNVAEQYAADTVEVTKRVETALEELRPGLVADGIMLEPDLFRPANFITIATTNVRDSLIIGGVLVIVVLYLFLFDLPTAAISCTAIPLSLLTATLVLERLGITLNTMTLGGLAIAIGVVVDDAVIDVENIVRRLRENARLAAPRPFAHVVLDATFEVRSAVVYATFAVILVVFPIVTLSGLTGRLFAPMGFAYSLAVLASLIVALTVTPALATALLPGRVPPRDPPMVRWARTTYEALLQQFARRPRTLMATAAVFTVAGCTALPFFAGEFIPELKEGHFVVHMSAVPGTSLEQSLRVGSHVADTLLKLPAVRSVAQRAGRAEQSSEDTWGPHYSEFEVDLKSDVSGDDAEHAQTDIRRAFADLVGVNSSVMTFLTERIEETLSGYTAAVVINVFGNDLNVLDQQAQEIARVVGELEGATDVEVQSPPGLPQLTISLRKPDLERWGFDAVTVLDLIRVAYQGDIVGQTFKGNEAFHVITILDQTSRNNITKIGELPLRSPSGSYVALKQIADIREVAGRYQVLHEGARRVQTVTVNVTGTDVPSFVQAAKAAIAKKVPLASGTYIQFAGTGEAQSRSRRDLALNSLIAGVGVVLLLSIITRNWRNLLLILANLPFALVGGVLAVFVTGGLLSLGAMVGFVTLFGITLRNSILMIAHYEHLVEAEGMQWELKTAIKGASDRLIPILMTSIVTALGILPLALGRDDPGREIQGPMAIVVLGGVLTSMALNLLVLPTLAVHYGRFGRSRDEESKWQS